MTDVLNAADADGSSQSALVAGNHIDWLIDNAETYGRLLESLSLATHSVRIAQLAFDADCAAYAGGSLAESPSEDAMLAEILIELARTRDVRVEIVLNASWILDTARPLSKFLAKRGVARSEIEVRGLSRFPHFMHAKLVLIDEREAFLLGSPFVNSYWDNGSHIPYDARRPLRELGGRPLHDVSVRVCGPVVSDLERMFEGVWKAAASGEAGGTDVASLSPETDPEVSEAPTIRIVCDAPDGILPVVPPGAMQMLGEIVDAIARARSFIYIEHQYLTSRPVVAALADALHRVPGLEIILVLNQNPDLTAYRGWQNVRLREHGLLTHPRVGVFTLWSTDAHPEREGLTRINQLFIHSKVIVIDDEWAAVGTSNLDGVSMGDYGGDFAGALGRRVFLGVRNVEVNIVMACGDADVANGDVAESIVALRERLWREHLGVPREELAVSTRGGWLAAWREAARENVRRLGSLGDSVGPQDTHGMAGRLLPYSERAYPREQLEDVGVQIDPARLVLCYNPTWFSVVASPHWIRNIF